jgi:hypothetical protein
MFSSKIYDYNLAIWWYPICHSSTFVFLEEQTGTGRVRLFPFGNDTTLSVS